MDNESAVEVLDVRMELPGDIPVLLLKVPDQDQMIRVWIGESEAVAITMARHGISPTRPNTHQLLVNSLEQLDASLESVCIESVEQRVFFASLRLSNGAEIDARCSDAIALALIADVSVYCSTDVIDQVGVPSEIVGLDIEGLDEESEVPAEQDEVEQFREFLEDISPDDFEDPGSGTTA